MSSEHSDKLEESAGESRDTASEAGSRKEADVELKGVIQKISEKKPEMMQELMMGMVGSVGHPLIHKLNEEHVTKVLELMVQHDQNQYQLSKDTNDAEADASKTGRWFVFATFLVLVALTTFVLVYYKDKPDILQNILSGLGGLVAGGLGGYGLAKRDS